MELKVDGVSRTTKIERIAGKFVRILKREALKTRIHPSFSDKNAEVDILRPNKDGLVKLSLKYNSPVSAIEAYKTIYEYEVLSKELGVINWDDPVVSVVSIDKFFDGTWNLEGVAKGELEKELEKNVLLVLRMNGLPNSFADKLKPEFNFWGECGGYREIGTREGLPMILSPMLWFYSEIKGLDVDEMKEKLGFARRIKESCWLLRDKSGYKDQLQIHDENVDVFSFKKVNSSIDYWDIRFFQGTVAGKKVMARYVPKKSE